MFRVYELFCLYYYTYIVHCQKERFSKPYQITFFGVYEIFRESLSITDTVASAPLTAPKPGKHPTRYMCKALQREITTYAVNVPRQVINQLCW